MKYLKQTDAKVYNCIFQLQLFELRIFLKFPCKFFIEWKTVTGSQLARTQGFCECVDGKAIFNQKLSLDVEMLQDSSKNIWIKKDSAINVYLITRNKPDFNQLAGRINIDLGAALENNPYQKPLIQSLTYSSTSADLKFSLNIKQIIQSKKPVSQLNLSEFNDRLYLVSQNGNMSKSKSLEHLKNAQHMISPVFPNQKSESNIKLKFPKTKLSNFAHGIMDSVEFQSDFATSSNEADLRMTLGKDRKAISRQDYEEMIEFQTKGMKKSNLMVIPDIKKSRVQDEESQFNTQHQKKASEDDFLNNHQQQFVQQMIMRRTGSENKCEYKRSKSPQSEVDIIVDLPDVFHSKQLNPKNLKRKETNNLMNSMNSSNSFSISRFKAHLQDSGQQNADNVKSLKQSFNSVELQSNFANKKLTNPGQKDAIQQGNENVNRIEQLQNQLNNLSTLLKYNKEKLQKLQEQNVYKDKTIKKMEVENQQLTSKIAGLQQKTQYQTKINSLNCEKLKHVSSQLSIERSRIRTSEGSSSPNDIMQLKTQISNLKQKLQKSNLQKTSFKEKLLQRDQIELQNQIKIQELQADLVKYRHNNQKISPNTTFPSSFLQIQSKINNNKSSLNSQLQSNQQQTISFLKAKVQQIEQQNSKIKNLYNQKYPKQSKLTEKDHRMRENLVIIEQQFQSIAKQLLEKEKLLQQKTKEVQTWKKKSHVVTFNTSALDELKQRPLEEQLRKKSHLLQDYELHILTLEEELQRVQAQNKQLTGTYNKLMRESYRFEGDLKVIKEQESFRQSFKQSFRQSFGSSGEGFRQSCSLTLNIKQQNIVTLYKQAVQSCYNKLKINQKFDIQFSAQLQDIRKKAFIQLERSSKIINDLLKCMNSLESDLSETKGNIQRVQKTLKTKIQEMQTKLDEIQENQLISAAGSSNVTPLIGSIIIKPLQKDQFDQYSQATKKRAGLNLNVQSKLNRQVQKLKSIIYDKNKEISDLIASYQKLRLQNQTQCMLIKSKNLKIEQRNDEQVDTELVHDILDLQIRLNQEKQKKNQVMEQLQLRRSLNRSQEISQFVNQVDISTIYKEIRAIITSRQNYIETEQSFNRLITKINQIDDNSEKSDKNYKLIYFLEERSRSMSKQLQVIKLTLMKTDFKQLQKHSSKTFFSDIFKPSQHVINQILVTLEQIINNYQ